MLGSHRSAIGLGAQVSHTREIALSTAGLAITLIAVSFFIGDVHAIFWARLTGGDYLGALEQGAFIFLTTIMLWGNFVYQICRLGYFQRLRSHAPASPDELRAFAAETSTPGAIFLLPSYKEDERVVFQALMSCALQEHPNRRVVLLIDDPPRPGNAQDQNALNAARELPGRVQRLLAAECKTYRVALADFEQRARSGSIDVAAEVATLAKLHLRVASWFAKQAAATNIGDHSDRLYVDDVLLARARIHRDAARQFGVACVRSEREIAREYGTLATLFDVQLTSFERKRYTNLSHEPNKAMNLNAYLELIGGHYAEVHHADGVHLVAADAAQADLHVPDAPYVVTLDADSLLRSDYALRLIQMMEQPGNERMAVAQTPYSAIPHPTSVLERVAGATTDVQYIIHQGFTRYGATFWVGANAVLRRAALRDIRTEDKERGFTIARYIQDRTVIEDTESTVDMIDKGWTLHNYPERLSHSATPPDFGSFLIQRRRWANGGLIILPKLLRYLFRRPWSLRKLAQGLMQVHYLGSIAAVNISFMLLLLCAFEEPMRSWWLPLTVVPYFYLYGRDMTQRGYSWGDLARVYALNLMLIPINLGGVFCSIQQMIAGKRIPFGRTPKVLERTAAPASYVVAEYLLLACFAAGLFFDAVAGRYMHAAFAGLNGAFFAYVLWRLIGWRHSKEDVALGLKDAATRLEAATQWPKLAAACALTIRWIIEPPPEGRVLHFFHRVRCWVGQPGLTAQPAFALTSHLVPRASGDYAKFQLTQQLSTPFSRLARTAARVVGASTGSGAQLRRRRSSADIAALRPQNLHPTMRATRRSAALAYAQGADPTSRRPVAVGPMLTVCSSSHRFRRAGLPHWAFSWSSGNESSASGNIAPLRRRHRNRRPKRFSSTTPRAM